MPKKKYFYYVLVITPTGPVFVTSIDRKNKTAYWNREEKPLEMGKYDAEGLTIGLGVNGSNCFTVSQPFQIDYQPYNYKHYEIKIVQKDKCDIKCQKGEEHD